ncbi:MAG TPA: 16S rRNA (cytosine(967)-C(5))-methyltransferase RsmB [Candidatus Binatia bacterium]|nr:16S rRNA (cytosine(967)-C(5))-methyltransferase RsmB [Candidatus Binatia bacterium]
MAWLSARRLALTALRTWRKEKRFADSIVSDFLTKAELTESDRAFAFELFYGVLRNLTLLDFWIGCLRSARLDIDLRDVVRLGLYQLFLLKTAQHAAVHETVDLVPRRQRMIVNGMLRAAIRQQNELLARADAQPLFVRASHPQFLVERWQQHFGIQQAEELCKWNNLPAPIYARINLLRIDQTEFLQLYPESRPLPNHPNFVKVSSLPSAALEQGHCYIQDPSTTIAGQLLDPTPGERILDACAAPGGKTALIAERVKNRAFIAACDRDRLRVRAMHTNFQRLGVHIASVAQCDWLKASRSVFRSADGLFDRVLVDAPCSNTGVMRRRVDVRWRLTPTDFARMHERQIAIVRAVVRLLKPGGVVVYSTCSLEPEENEDVVQQILDSLPALRLAEEKRSLPFRDCFDGAFAAKLVRTA